MKKMNENVMKVMNGLAELLVKQTANSTCIWIAHQPEFPKEADKYKKYDEKSKK